MRTSLRLKLSGLIGQRQQQLSDRLHQSGDAYAEAHGWTIIRTTGLFGFGGRRYRDPRFDMPSHHSRAGRVTSHRAQYSSAFRGRAERDGVCDAGADR